MLGSEAARRIGLATEALQLFMAYVATRLPELRLVSAKLHSNNHVAQRFFERNGMHVHKHSPLLQQTEMRLVLGKEARARLNEQWVALGGGTVSCAA